MKDNDRCLFRSEQSSNAGSTSDDNEDDEPKILHQTLSSQKETKDKAEGAKVGDASGGPTKKVKPSIQVEDLSNEERQEDQIISFESENLSKTALKQMKSDQETKLAKAQKQPKNDNESLFQQEMKPRQNKKDFYKEKKTFVERKEVEKGGGVRRLQQQVSKETGYWKAPAKLNWVRFCFGIIFLLLFWLAAILIIVILLNFMPDLGGLEASAGSD